MSTALNAVLGLCFFGESISLTKVLALFLVIGGIVLINHSPKPQESPESAILSPNAPYAYPLAAAQKRRPY